MKALICVVLLCPLFAAHGKAEATASAGWTSDDSVSLSALQEWALGWQPTCPGRFQYGPGYYAVSPDGRFLLLRRSRGDIPSDLPHSTIDVFEIASIELALDGNSSALKVEPSLVLNGAMDRIAWDPENSRMLFVRTLPNAEELWQVSLPGGKQRRLAKFSGVISDYRVVGDRALLISQIQLGSSPWIYPVSYGTQIHSQSGDSWPVRGGAPAELLRAQLVCVDGDDARAVEQAIAVDNSSIWMSPTGQEAVFVQQVDSSLERTFASLDLISGKVRALAIASTALHRRPQSAVWSNNGSRCVLVDSSETSSNPSAEAILGLSIYSRGVVIAIEPLKLRKLERFEGGKWIDADTFILSLHSRGWVRTVTCTLQDGAWISISGASTPATPAANGLPFDIRVDQTSSKPPLVTARKNGNGVTLLDMADHMPDHLLVAPRRLMLKDGSGSEIPAALWLPMPKGEAPPPLIIQNYPQSDTYSVDLFSPDGLFRGTCYSAQVLVNRGFAVVQTGIDGHNVGRQDEQERVVRCLDAVVDQLEEQGLIDADRVGLLGFSRGGFQAYYALTHPGKTRFAAIVVDDAYTGSFPDFLRTMASSTMGARSAAAVFGGKTFWEDKELWVKQGNEFNIDRAQAPVLFSEKGLMHANNKMLETIGAFRAARKPFELLVFPRGQHMLRRPLEQKALIDAVADWMDFWINGREVDAAKSEQYERWRKMRSDMDREAGGNTSPGRRETRRTLLGIQVDVAKVSNGATPRDGEVAVLKFVGKLADGKVFMAGTREPSTLKIGGGRYTPGLHDILRVMRRGESAVAEVPAVHAYGDKGRPRTEDGVAVPPASGVRYEIELVDIKRGFLADAVKDKIAAAGIDAAGTWARSVDPNGELSFDEDYTNRAGYLSLTEGSLESAFLLFALNAELFPQSANAWDSLAEIHMMLGRRDEAISLFQRSHSLDPLGSTLNNGSLGPRVLKRLKQEPGYDLEYDRLLALSRYLPWGKLALAPLQKAVLAYLERTPAAPATEVESLLRTFLAGVAQGYPKEYRPILEELSTHRNSTARKSAEARLSQLARQARPVEMVFTSLNGQEVDLEKLRGKVVLIEFWATWCSPCIEEIPNIVTNYRKYRDKGFEIVGITLDRVNKPEKEILEFCEKYEMPWPQCFDVKRGDSAFAKQFGIEAIPAMLLLDRNGMIVSTNARGPKLEDEIKRLLKL